MGLSDKSRGYCFGHPLAEHWLFRLVLLGLERSLLPTRHHNQGMVSALRRPIRHGGIECSLLFLADHRDRSILGPPSSKPPIYLHRQGVRVNYTYKTVHKNYSAREGFLLHRPLAQTPHGMLSVSASAQLPLHRASPQTDPRPARFEQAECR